MFNPAIGVLFIYYLYITEHTSEKCSSIIQIDEHFFCNKFIYKSRESNCWIHIG